MEWKLKWNNTNLSNYSRSIKNLKKSRIMIGKSKPTDNYSTLDKKTNLWNKYGKLIGGDKKTFLKMVGTTIRKNPEGTVSLREYVTKTTVKSCNNDLKLLTKSKQNRLKEAAAAICGNKSRRAIIMFSSLTSIKKNFTVDYL